MMSSENRPTQIVEVFLTIPTRRSVAAVLVSRQTLVCSPVSTGILGNSLLPPISVVSHFQSTSRHLLTSGDRLLGDCS